MQTSITILGKASGAGPAVPRAELSFQQIATKSGLRKKITHVPCARAMLTRGRTCLSYTPTPSYIAGWY